MPRSRTVHACTWSSRTSRGGWAINIRKFVVAADELADLVRLGTLPEQAARFLTAAVESGLNILVAGGTQSGKPTTSQTPPCRAACRPARSTRHVTVWRNGFWGPQDFYGGW